jgi:hypothetical protein
MGLESLLVHSSQCLRWELEILLGGKVFERLGDLDRKFTCPPPDDWIFASKVCEKLELFYQLTEVFSGTKYVTANLFFP